MRTKNILAIFSYVMLCCAQAAAGPLAEGNAAYDRGDYAAALKFYRQAASQGEGEGEAEAEEKLGMMYDLGRGVPKDMSIAMMLYRESGQHGNGKAFCNIASIYEVGDAAAPQNYAEAAKWYRKAADLGNTIGQEHLGAMYLQGLGVPEDYVLAYMWSNLAAAKGDKFAIANREIASEKMTPGQVGDAQRMSREWKPVQ